MPATTATPPTNTCDSADTQLPPAEKSVTNALLHLPFDVATFAVDKGEEQIDSGVCGSPKSLRSEEEGDRQTAGSSNKGVVKVEEGKLRDNRAVVSELRIDQRQGTKESRVSSERVIDSEDDIGRRSEGFRKSESHDDSCASDWGQDEGGGGMTRKGRRTDRPKRPPRRRVVGKRAIEEALAAKGRESMERAVIVDAVVDVFCFV